VAGDAGLVAALPLVPCALPEDGTAGLPELAARMAVPVLGTAEFGGAL
jgi:hypothetical protein